MKTRNYKNIEIEGNSQRGYIFSVNGFRKYASCLWKVKMKIDNYDRDSKDLPR